MKYEKFKKIIDLQISQYNRISSVYKLKINLIEFYDDHESVIEILWREILDEKGLDWLNWFLYEKDGISGKPKKELTANDGGKEICKNLKGLHEYLVKNKYFKVK